jgi:hypothetical protein
MTPPPTIQGAEEFSDIEMSDEAKDSSGLLMAPNKDIDTEVETISVPVFDNHVQMYEKLKSFAYGDIKSSMDAAWNEYFSQSIGATDIADDFKAGLSQFFEVDPQSEDAVDIANRLFDMYSKIHPPQVQEEEMDIATASTMHVMKLARDVAESERKQSSVGKFNLTKTAQHKSIMHGTIMSGPGQTSLSPFSRDIQSGLHLVEQNKGFGLKIDDVLDIDFEAIWRGNVMDKYNAPYRDAEGNYVGGYINRRFEVNRNIPVGNNLQLLPGTRGRPWMPQYSTLESRMEVLRGNEDKLVNPATFNKISIGPFNLKKKNS